MPELITPQVREHLRHYLRVIRTLHNETARRETFAGLIFQLFPESKAVTAYVGGVEKGILITTNTGQKRGRADVYYGDTIVEFETSLPAKRAIAEDQLREYVAGSWQENPDRTLLTMASDGVTWYRYRPVLPEGKTVCAENITLELLGDFKVTEDNLDEFWLRLTSFLFRPQQIDLTPERFRLDFGSESPLYQAALAALKRAWSDVSADPEAQLVFETWQSYLTVTYGKLPQSTRPKKDTETGKEISELEELFLRHTYLASVARLLIWAVLTRGKADKDFREIAKDVNSGRFFESKRLANLVDDDFFHWIRRPDAEQVLAAIWERVVSQMTDYNCAQIRQDVLKGVYQELIEDRHELGEYYTPDWLCERVVQEMLPTHGFHKVLDPSCGSGSFLRAAIAHFLTLNTHGSDNDRLRSVLSNVVGIDIHPVAVTISRATYILALGKLVNAARKPIQIPVYLADSLFLPREDEANQYDQLSGTEIEYGKDKRQVIVPNMLLQRPDLFDDAIAACAEVAKAHARSQKETRKNLEHYLSRHVPELSTVLGYEAILDALWSFTEGLAELIHKRHNSIWSFIIRNSYRPAMLKQQFDYIIGNPPWLAYGYISDPKYQHEVKQRARGDYEIAPESETHFGTMELATVFLAHSMSTFASPKGRLAFVMPRSILNADQHQKLRERTYSPRAKLRLTGWWDMRDVLPLFNVPTCVLFAYYDLSTPGQHVKDVLNVLEWSGRLPKDNMPWDAAKHCFTAVEKRGRLIWLGRRSAFSTSAGATSASKASKYQAVFKQGANLLPRAFYFVKLTDFDISQYDPEREYWAETDADQPKKKPYEDVKISDYVEGRFIFSTGVARHLLPFALLEPVPIVLPIQVDDKGGITLRDSERLRESGYRDMATWMEQAEAIFKEKREEKSGRATLAEWTDYQGQLTSQSLKQRHIVLYNSSGTHVAAAHFDRESRTLPFIVDQRMYWAGFHDAREADYLAAVLNSRTANQMIKPFQSRGLLGERDIHKKLLELPIPLFDENNSLHKKLADLGAEASRQAAKAVRSAGFPVRMIGRQRVFVREAMQAALKDIDAVVKQVFQRCTGEVEGSSVKEKGKLTGA